MTDDAPPNALTGHRAIVFGADTPPGRDLAAALRDAGVTVGLTSTTTDGQALFALKRAAAGGPAEAVDLANPTSVRVATKKLRKALGGLEFAALVLDGAALGRDPTAATEPLRIAAKEIARGGDVGRVALVVIGVADPAAPQALELPGVDSAALLLDDTTDAGAVVQRALAWLAGCTTAAAAGPTR